MEILGWIIAIGLLTNVIAMVIPWNNRRQKMHLCIGSFLGLCFILKLLFE